MNFKNEFESALLHPLAIDAKISENTLPGKLYPVSDDICAKLVSVLSFADVLCHHPFSYHLRYLNCYMLLYTKIGTGILQQDNRKIFLKEQTLLLFNCRQTFSLFISESSWSFEVFFLTGSNIDAYSQMLASIDIPYDLHSYSSIQQHFMILAKNGGNFSTRNTMLDLKCITNIFTELGLLLLNLNGETIKAPPYLLYMKECFDFSYSKSFSLQNFEDKLMISKYRLCREFSNYYGISPLQYLNQKRMEAAKVLLCTTSIPVHEVGAAVGIENTNHFINLFKRQTQVTPYSFRQNIHKK